MAGGLLCGIMGIVTGVWHATRKAELDAALKQDMLNRGMSPEEIRMVIDAGANPDACRKSRKRVDPSYAREV